MDILIYFVYCRRNLPPPPQGISLVLDVDRLRRSGGIIGRSFL